MTPTPTLERRPDSRSRRRWIEQWDPEDEVFWEASGKRIARRNLALSIFAEHLGFNVWVLWSIVVVGLPDAGFSFTAGQVFWLISLPGLLGALLRLPYTFAVPRFGGRRWTAVSALLLLVPTGLLAWCVSNPDTPYGLFLLAAATAGFGGGNFASSMANISFFYPERRKGFALGLNASGGNIGVAVVQFAVPIVVSAATGVGLAAAGLMWMPLIVLAAAGAVFFMDDLAVVRSDVRSQLVAAKRPHTWVISVLYIGTFGSFVGYSMALPLLISTEFPAVEVGDFAYLGALVGSVSRPVGGWLADRVGGARVTAWTFVVMGAGATGVIAGVRSGSFAMFLASFLVLFATTGVGNGSTYRMIPAIFRATVGRAEGAVAARREAAACIGIAAAVGALGGFLVPQALRASLADGGSLEGAFSAFLAYYAVCLAATWWCYLRRRAVAGFRPVLAGATV